MTEDRKRRGARRAISRTELVVVVLAAVAGLVAIVVGTVVDTSVTPVGADVSAAGAASPTPAAGARVPAAASDASAAAPDEPDTSASAPTPGEIGQGRSTERPAQAPRRQPRHKVNPLVEQVEAIARKTKPSTTSFRIATLNILGSNHARNGLSRAAREAALLRDRGVQILGLQEVQRDQRPVFIDNLPAMRMWPQDELGRDGYRVQIMWRADRFEMVEGRGSSHTFNGIGGVPIPYVLLRDKSTGARFWVIVTHNSPQGRQGERNASAETQIALVNRLRASHPVLLMGDLNEKTTVFCKFATRAGMTAANGGSGAGGCRPPGGPQRIDWILGSADAIEFSNYVQDNATVANGLSDHHLIYADAKVADKAS